MPHHSKLEFASKFSGKQYKKWFSESGVYYELDIDGLIEDLLAGNASPEKIEEGRQEEVLRRAFHQCGSIQFDGFLYTNLLDEFKSGSTPINVGRKAFDWGMESTRVSTGEGGFPRPQAGDIDTSSWLRTTGMPTIGLGPRFFQHITSLLQSLATRLLSLVKMIIVPLLKLLNLWSFSAISVNTLPPSLSFEFEPTAGAIPIGNLLSIIGGGMPIPTPAVVP